jgi:hypothetical protein
MGGGLMQLVAYGAQDIYLTGNPQITFFKVVYRRHTNFSMETISQTVNGNASNATGGSSTVTISRNGDLVHKVYVNFKTASTRQFLSSFGQVELEIGGQRIDRHSGQWLATWLDLSTPAGRAYEVSTLIGDAGTNAQTTPGVGSADGKVNVAQIPLQFWFCRNPGLALPLIALQYHEVKLKFEWKGPTDTSEFDVLCDYIYLDTDERRRFAQVSHEYLIEQVQEQTETVSSSSPANLRLNFNHPVKELIWSFGTSTLTNALMGASTANPKGSAGSPPTARLQLNGHDRFSDMPMEYFGLRQCIDYHSAVPGPNLGQTLEGGYMSGSSDGNTSGSVCSDFKNAVYVYSFALKPEEHQPSGTCNFSRIDNAKLICSDTGNGSDTCKIFAVNYNVLRIMSGMGGLAYSN